MKEIPLKNSSLKAMVDDDLFESLMRHEWYVLRSRKSRTSYAYRHARRADGTRVRVLMHREVLGLSARDGRHVDHIDGQGLLNVRSNLRVATASQNLANKRVYRNSSTGFKGVSPHRKSGKNQAYISWECRDYYLGLYLTPSAAAVAYNAASERLHGTFSQPNVIPNHTLPAADEAALIRTQVNGRLDKCGAPASIVFQSPLATSP